MTLSALIRKREIATATVATPATHNQAKAGTVAKVASVAVANPLLAEELESRQQAPVVVCGRTFRTCRACGRMGWHPQATAEICCGSAMQMIEQPALTVAEYVNFIGCPKAYATGAITRGDVLDMMRRDHINPLPGLENVAAAIL